MKADVVVLGAGVVGVCAALDLQWRGRDVVLLDRHAAPACETSYGNAGLIERASVFPYLFPREFRAFLRYATNLAPEAHYHLRALPHLAPWLWRYFRNSSPRAASRIASAALPLIEHSLSEHETWASRAGVLEQIRRTGWIKLFRTDQTFQSGSADARRAEQLGVKVALLSPSQLIRLEPSLKGRFAGAVHYLDTASVANPAGLVRAYADLFRSRGGRFAVGEAMSLRESEENWIVETASSPLAAREVVVALGPWSERLCRQLGYRLPIAVKRGYHIHFSVASGAGPTRPLLDQAGGFVLSPMDAGVRMTTGAEFALLDAPPTPVQVDRAEKLARDMFDFGARLETSPWMGARPCLPDMLPVIGPAPGRRGLWFNFGHQHHGLTLGPASARLLGEVMSGETPFTDVAPYRADRF